MKKRVIVICAVIPLLLTLISCKRVPQKTAEHEFYGTVLAYVDNSVTVAPLEDEEEIKTAGKITFSRENLPDINAQMGEVVLIKYNGEIRETYPAQIDVVYWEKRNYTNRQENYTGEWLDKETAEKYDHQPFGDITVTEIYKDCFFAKPVIPMPYIIKLNGSLSEEWRVGDQLEITGENFYYEKEGNRMEADFKTVKRGTFEMQEGMAYKPVIYLYPEEETDVLVKLDINGEFVCTYPEYKDGWCVRARPDGTLTDGKREYNYLYWEAALHTEYDFSEGFCVKGEDTAAFLETALEKLGLTPREANEFIVFWLPQMERNEYNIISFQSDAYTDAAALTVSPAPDTVIRVFMAYKPSGEFANINPQELSAPAREGFTVVEWGGAVNY